MKAGDLLHCICDRLRVLLQDDGGVAGFQDLAVVVWE